MKLSPEVLTYIQTVKNYLKKNDEARKYFLTGVDEDFFFQHLSEISQKNFNSLGEAMLNKEQFDLLRNTMKAISIVNKSKIEDTQVINPEENIFIDMRGLSKICLN
jgi:hypothetical protein